MKLEAMWTGAIAMDNQCRAVAGQVFNIWHGHENSDLALMFENRSGLDARVCDLILFRRPKGWVRRFQALGSLRPEFDVGNSAAWTELLIPRK